METGDNMEKQTIYLDNSATTRVDDEVVSSISNYYTIDYGNPSSLHRMGFAAEKAINNSREIISDYIKVPFKSIYFTSGGTEGNNMAIYSALQKNKHKGNKIITSKIEHPSVLEVFKYYSSQGYDVVYLDVDKNGNILKDHLTQVLDSGTILVSIMKINNEIGSVQNIKEIAAMIKEKSPHCIIHCDCVQAFGKILLYPMEEGMDIMTFSGHKFHGPKGVGGIYINEKLNMNPLLYGGGQEKGMRSGTENVPGIVGMGKAVELLADNFKYVQEHLYKLKDYCVNELLRVMDNVHFNSYANDCAPHIINISFPGIKGEVLLHLLEDKGIYVSTGSACASRKRSQSHVLKSIGSDSQTIDGSIRISFSKYNNTDEIDVFVKELKQATEFLYKYSRR